VNITDEVEEMVKRAIQSYGRLDYAHNNAGIEYNRSSIVNGVNGDAVNLSTYSIKSKDPLIYKLT